MTAPNPTHLFISYAVEDTALARWLAWKLAARGPPVWFDQMKLPGGKSWLQTIPDAIKQRTFRMLTWISEHSLRKQMPTGASHQRRRLARSGATTYSSAMSTISVSELKKKPAKQWLKSVSKEDLVITSKGRPIAVLLRIAPASVESIRALVGSVRALQAQSALQQAAAASGASRLSMSDIDAEIAATRRARRRK